MSSSLAGRRAPGHPAARGRRDPAVVGPFTPETIPARPADGTFAMARSGPAACAACAPRRPRPLLPRADGRRSGHAVLPEDTCPSPSPDDAPRLPPSRSVAPGVAAVTIATPPRPARPRGAAAVARPVSGDALHFVEGARGAIDGAFEEIAVRDERTGYTAGMFTLHDGRRIGVVATLPAASVGVPVTLVGEIRRDPRFGLRFRDRARARQRGGRQRADTGGARSRVGAGLDDAGRTVGARGPGPRDPASSRDVVTAEEPGTFGSDHGHTNRARSPMGNAEADVPDVLRRRHHIHSPEEEGVERPPGSRTLP